jgi:hypothetical protein
MAKHSYTYDMHKNYVSTAAEHPAAALSQSASSRLRSAHLLLPAAAQAEVFEELATMDHPFEGIPTIPPRKDTAHMVFYCNGCRYRVSATPDMTVAEVCWGAIRSSRLLHQPSLILACMPAHVTSTL